MKIETAVKDWIADYLEGVNAVNSDIVRKDMVLSKILSHDEICELVEMLGTEIGVDIPPQQIPWLKTVGDLIHIFCAATGSDEYDDSEPAVTWRGVKIALRKPILCEGQNLKIFEVINDPIYGRIYVTYHGFIKRYAYADTCNFVTDQTIIDALDNKYGRPVAQRGIIY